MSQPSTAPEGFVDYIPEDADFTLSMIHALQPTRPTMIDRIDKATPYVLWVVWFPGMLGGWILRKGDALKDAGYTNLGDLLQYAGITTGLLGCTLWVLAAGAALVAVFS